jgi:thiamine biosynthesis lipoprotein
MEFTEFRAMNTQIVLAGEGSATRVAEGFALARALIAKRAAQFTRFQDTSELSRLNRAAGEWFNASPELFDVLQQAYELHFQTQGLFDPAILAALENVGYDASMDVVRTRAASANALYPPVMSGTFRALSFHAAQRAVWLPTGTRVDLGGIAKGWIAEEAAHLLAEYTTACAVNAGGDIFAVGLPENETAWEIELEDPCDSEHILTLLRVPPGAVATSSITKRKWKQGAHERHHLIDPRTGLSAATDWLSVTVMAPHATVAEVFAKALLIAGSREALAVAEERSDVEFIAVDHDGKLWGSENAKEFLNERVRFV